MREASRILVLIKKEWQLELRRPQAFLAVILFTLSLCYILYKSFNTLGPREWGTMIWIAVLFASLNAIVKSFIQEDAGSNYFYFQIIKPTELLIAKLVYNYFFIFLIFALMLGGFSFFLDNPIRDPNLFLQGAALGILGINIVFTTISALSGIGTGGSSTLMAILALPLILPILLLLIKITAVASGLIADSSVDMDLQLLLGIDLLYLSVIFLMFKELWKG